MDFPKLYFHINVAQCLTVIAVGVLGIQYLKFVRDAGGFKKEPNLVETILGGTQW